MCATYLTVDTIASRIARDFESLFSKDLGKWSAKIVPHTPAPVIVWNKGKRRIEVMNFSLIPAWSKVPKPKFPTYNARLSSYDEKSKKDVAIYEKPTWRGPFARRHCLVPMAEFIEPSYRGDLGGNMLRFFRKDEKPLAAAGIWEEWESKETGEIIESFAIITTDPDPFIKKNGHDRSPLFLEEDAYDQWLNPEGAPSPAELVKFLEANTAHPKFEVEIERPLKAGWEKRKPD